MGNAWAAIAAKEEVSPQDAKHLWSRLLGIYRTNKAKVKKTTQTGAGNDDVFRPRWFAYQAMSFVDEATQDAVHVDTLHAYDYRHVRPLDPPAATKHNRHVATFIR
ncbi:uncharacterized protein LOC120908288 [Anopheles arabiensis]|uniref:uncharacterized protein LOC120908288 n=1 Tax=Anopheles arabiensis TaxID=7173 RepID=UPI001AACAC75|nr:uncharacterized protein LOC120908288 [Anopheles arabiensis]